MHSVRGQEVGMFLIDYEKAYDRIEWEIIYMIFDAMEFQSSFLSMVKVLMKDANAPDVDVNGHMSHSFKLSRSIKQGCPLALALFFITTKALYYLLHDNFLSHRIHGPLLPNGQEISNI